MTEPKPVAAYLTDKQLRTFGAWHLHEAQCLVDEGYVTTEQVVEAMRRMCELGDDGSVTLEHGIELCKQMAEAHCGARKAD
jgi:hypothetical protein